MFLRISPWLWFRLSLGRGQGSGGSQTLAPEPAPEKQPPQPIDAIRDKLLGDTAIVAAITDRLLHYGHVLSIRGESRRQVGGSATTARISDLPDPRPEGLRLIPLCQALVAPGKFRTLITVPDGTST